LTDIGFSGPAGGDPDAVIRRLEQDMKARPGVADARFALIDALNAQALAQAGQGALDAALAYCQRAVAIEADDVDALNTQGYVLMRMGRFNDAEACYNRALRVNPQLAELWSSLGNAVSRQGRDAEAVAAYDRVLALRPDDAQALISRAYALVKLGRNEEAAEGFAAAARLQPGEAYLEAAVLVHRSHAADWRDRDRLLAETARNLDAGLAAGRAVLEPFFAQSLYDDPVLLRRSAEILAGLQPPAQASAPLVPRRDDGRLRIAYFSSDFCDHPVAHLIASVIEHHNRERFEVVAVSLEGADDPWRRRIAAGAERFVDISALSDEAAVTALRALEIDIAIDLNGHTTKSRPGLFAARVAPVQTSYLGFLGTMGSDRYDYLLADETIVPAGAQAFYVEKIAYLPCYQANDDKVSVAPGRFSRADFGLPEGGFVFCSFNQTHKLTPEVFGGWMRILAQVPHSVLWLFARSRIAMDNLASEARKQGIGSDRIVFAAGVPYEDHLARQELADLFLDTHPYNAGATASNALRMGLPVLTRIGRSFQARMGASLLAAAGLPELITPTAEAYEALAVELATRPERIRAVRERLAANLPSCALFDTRRTTRALEDLYSQMQQRSRQGLAPETIRAGAQPATALEGD
jgi:predicted O-linked N-acetylglucosamine transferase (SPINDLY family)